MNSILQSRSCSGWPCLLSMIAGYLYSPYLPFVTFSYLYCTFFVDLTFLVWFDFRLVLSLYHCLFLLLSLILFLICPFTFSKTLHPFLKVSSFHSSPPLDLLLPSTPFFFFAVSTWVMCCMCISHRQRWVQQGQRRLPARVHQHSGLLRLSVSPWLCTAWEQTWL